MDYKEMLKTLIDEIDNNEFLEFLYKFANRLKKNWGV